MHNDFFSMNVVPNSIPQQAPRAGGRYSLLRRSVLSLLLLALGVSPLLWHYRVVLLTGIARTWEVNDTPEPADAIIVLGGGLNTRPFFAVKLYNQQLAPKILIAETHPTPADDLGVVSRETEGSFAVLSKLGVPSENIVKFGKDVTSTYEEACALRDWLREHNLHRVIIPTDFTHTRRVKWLMNRVLPANTKIAIVASPSLYYDETNWWQREEGVISLQNEVLKIFYYRLKY